LTKAKVSELLGYTPGQIRGRIQRGFWRKGIEWAWIDGAQMLNVDAINARATRIAESQADSEELGRQSVIRLS
jgi:hypothetical protein